MSFKKLSCKIKKNVRRNFINLLKIIRFVGPKLSPAFTGTLNFENKYSKKMFILNSKIVLLEVKPNDDDKHVEDEAKENKPQKLTFQSMKHYKVI